MVNRLKRAEKLKENTSEVDSGSEEYDSIVNFSRRCLSLPEKEFWTSQLTPIPSDIRPFELREPDLEEIRGKSKDDLLRENPLPSLSWLVLIPLASITATVVAYSKNLLAIAIVFSVIAVISIIFYIVNMLRKRRALRDSISEKANAVGHNKFEADMAQWRKDQSDFNTESERLKEQHDNADRSRIAELKLLLSGDTPSIEHALESDFDELEVPFNTEVSFQIENSDCVMLDVDLPEIEDCIMTTTKSVLKSGEIREKAKPRKIQNQEYAQLVIGFGFYLASRVYNLAPTISSVLVSGYTQRHDKSTGLLKDDYVFSIIVQRSTFAEINFAHADVIAATSRFSCRLKKSASFELASVDPFVANDVVS
jgi:hypothetical protein